ncbi:MAG: hypothetical protein ACK6DP_06780 [Gemmatimonas sp.]|jgi:hypothetical protein|uniref:hypothetical protein n=1 Tax=Gemmatimonas sp. TaxID=1962908 RepID=UPI00391F0908|nr:hypothetical protein [Gemmatimonadota bacterium]
MSRFTKSQLARVVVSLLLAAGAMSGTGCYRGGVNPSGNTVILVVTNRGFFDVNVFSVRSSGGNSRRLGLVNGNSTRTIQVPENELQPGGTLVLAVRAVAGRFAWTSQPVQTGPGVIARLDVISTGSGDLSQSQLYTQYSRPPEPIDTVGGP